MVLRWLVDLIHRKPRQVVGASLLLLLLSLSSAAYFLKFEGERSAMLDPKERYRALEAAYQSEFPGEDDLVVVIEGGTRSQREIFVDQLVLELKDHPSFSDVFGRTDLNFFRQRALAYVPAKMLDQALASDQAAKLKVVAGFLTKLRVGIEQGQPQTIELPLGKIQSPEVRLMLGQEQYLYNSLPETEIHIVLVRPTPLNKLAIPQLQNVLTSMRRAHPEVVVSLTGQQVIQADEISCAKRDARLATVLSAVFVLLLFRMSFPSLSVPLMGLSSVLVSVGWTLGFVTLCIGHLNMLTITFAAMLVGLGADFSIHVLLGFREARARDLSAVEAMQETMRTAGQENWLGALTSALAFAAICYTDFLGIRELGCIASVGVLLCFVGSVTLLPALVFIFDAEAPPAQARPVWAGVLELVEQKVRLRLGWVLVVSLVLSVFGGYLAREVRFDYNLLHLQDERLNSVRTELTLVSAGRGVLSAKCLAPNQRQARVLIEKMKRLGTVDRVESVLRLIPAQELSSVQWQQKLEMLKAKLQAVNSGSKFSPALVDSWVAEAAGSDDPRVREQAERVSSESARLKHLLKMRGPGPVLDAAKSMSDQLREEMNRLSALLDSQIPEQVTVKNLPPSLRLRGVGKSGQLAIRVYPKFDLWDHEQMERFVKDVQSVDPSACGLPISVFYHTESLKLAYERSAWTALSAISLTLLLYFRSFKKTGLALLPKLTGVVWMLGLMAVWGIDFNPVNFIALPMILGTGLVFGVHVVHRLLREPGRPLFAGAAGPAIALSGLATVAGFITLTTASHRGMASLGFVMTTGVLANLVTALLVLPAVMSLFHRPSVESIQVEQSGEKAGMESDV